MKLRNKKTGGIWDIPKMRHPTCQEDDISFFAELGTNGKLFSYNSLAKLNEEWEDYKPTEPLIKDEKIRKAVRAWAEYNSIEKVRYSSALKSCGLMCIGGYDFMIELVGLIPTLRDDEIYAITELCGEEGKCES